MQFPLLSDTVGKDVLSPNGVKKDSVATVGGKKAKVQSLTLKDGTVYVGEMKGKRPHGNGKAIYKNGDVYEGGFVKGRRSGKGEYRYKNGECYTGEFKDGYQHGEGTFTFADGRKYIGKWVKTLAIRGCI